MIEQIRFEKKGSLLYTRAWRKFVIAITVIYTITGVILATVDEFILDDVVDRVILFSIVLAMTLAMWLGYMVFLWLFKRESREAVDITEDGIRETAAGSRKFTFIPWAGVREIEFAATIVAGANLRVKGNFSEITISNIDLVITEPSGLRKMHRELGQIGQIRKLFGILRAGAPHAKVRMNRLARRRMKEYAWAQSF